MNEARRTPSLEGHRNPREVGRDSQSEVGGDSGSNVRSDAASEADREAGSEVCRDTRSEADREAGSEVCRDTRSEADREVGSEVCRDTRSEADREVGSEVCRDTRVVHTIGHSTRAIETFCGLLEAHAIDRVIDVRRWPASRRHPQFGREALAESLASHGIEYVWRAELGGFRSPRPDSTNTGWRTKAFRAYADFMLTPEFEAAVALLEADAAARRIALTCAEAVPWRCHRQLLADALTVRRWRVRHIMDDGCHIHGLTPFARPSGVRIHYGEGDLFTRGGVS